MEKEQSNQITKNPKKIIIIIIFSVIIIGLSVLTTVTILSQIFKQDNSLIKDDGSAESLKAQAKKAMEEANMKKALEYYLKAEEKYKQENNQAEASSIRTIINIIDRPGARPPITNEIPINTTQTN